MVITDPSSVRDARILLDTHVWVWAATGTVHAFAAAAGPLIEHAAQDERLYASAASVWEIALKAAKGELLVATDLHAWVAEQQVDPGIRIVSITPALAIDVTLLPTWLRRRDEQPHKDPSDRFIVATARKRNAVLLTCDEEIIHDGGQGHVNVYDVRP